MKPNNTKIRVLVADDHKVVRAGLSALLNTEPDIEVVGQAENGAKAVDETLRLKPDVVIMDLMMPVMDGLAATETLHEKAPEARILILTTFGTSDGIARALAAGASGALLKNADSGELASAIRIVHAGKQAISAEIRHQIQTDPPVPDLTPRQSEILNSMTQGLSNHDIAQQLGIRQDGVKEHINAIFTKIGAANRAEAVAIALRKHLLKI